MAPFARALLIHALPLTLVAAGCSSSTTSGGPGDGGSGSDGGATDSSRPTDSGNPSDSGMLPEVGGGDSGGMATCAAVCTHASSLTCYDMVRCNTNCSAQQAACNASGEGSQFQAFLNCADMAMPRCDAMNRVSFPSCASLVPTGCTPPSDSGLPDGATDTTCQMMPTAATCVNCCDNLHPQGLNTFAHDLANCECSAGGGMGVCQTPCATELCANPPVQPTTGDACDTCVKGSLGAGDGGSSACIVPVFQACMADTNCNAYFNCISGCPTM